MAYLDYKFSNYNKNKRKPYIEAKRDFQRQKRLNLHEIKEKRARKLNAMYKMDKNKFWRSIKRLEKQGARVDINIESIKKMYSELFNTPNETNQDVIQEVEREIKEFVYNYKNKDFNIKITPERIHKAISMLKNGKSSGFSDISNYQIFMK